MRKPVENSEFGIRSAEWVHSELRTPNSALRWFSYIWSVSVSVWMAADQSARASLRWNHLRFAVCGLVLALGLSGSLAWAEQAKKDQEKVVSKEVTGQVIWVGKRAISVEYDRTQESTYEMLLPVSSETKVERVKSLSELKRGDTVSVKYKQRSKKGEDGQDVILATVATKVALVRQASPEGTLRSKSETSLE